MAANQVAFSLDKEGGRFMEVGILLLEEKPRVVSEEARRQHGALEDAFSGSEMGLELPEPFFRQREPPSLDVASQELQGGVDLSQGNQGTVEEGSRFLEMGLGRFKPSREPLGPAKEELVPGLEVTNDLSALIPFGGWRGGSHIASGRGAFRPVLAAALRRKESFSRLHHGLERRKGRDLDSEGAVEGGLGGLALAAKEVALTQINEIKGDGVTVVQLLAQLEGAAEVLDRRAIPPGEVVHHAGAVKTEKARPWRGVVGHDASGPAQSLVRGFQLAGLGVKDGEVRENGLEALLISEAGGELFRLPVALYA